eukprot:5567655-Amphidinium_carterae.1
MGRISPMHAFTSWAASSVASTRLITHQMRLLLHTLLQWQILEHRTVSSASPFEGLECYMCWQHVLADILSSVGLTPSVPVES